jgi:hypothetical protein
VVELAGERYMSEALRGRRTELWLRGPELCREVLVKIVERELAWLREREAFLRTHHEEPAQAGAEVRRQVPQSREGVQLARLEWMREQQFIQAYQVFLKGRKESQKSGLRPGQSIADVNTSEAKSAVVAPPAHPEASDRARRQATVDRVEHASVASALAPGETSDIGARVFQGDGMRYEAIKEKPIPPPEEAHGLEHDVTLFPSGPACVSPPGEKVPKTLTRPAGTLRGAGRGSALVPHPPCGHPLPEGEGGHNRVYRYNPTHTSEVMLM